MMRNPDSVVNGYMCSVIQRQNHGRDRALFFLSTGGTDELSFVMRAQPMMRAPVLDLPPNSTLLR